MKNLFVILYHKMKIRYKADFLFCQNYPGHLVVLSCLATFVTVYFVLYNWMVNCEVQYYRMIYQSQAYYSDIPPIYKPARQFFAIYGWSAIRALIVALSITYLQNKLLRKRPRWVRFLYLGVLLCIIALAIR